MVSFGLIQDLKELQYFGSIQRHSHVKPDTHLCYNEQFFFITVSK